MENSPNEIIGEIMIHAMDIADGDILVLRCFAITCKRMMEIRKDLGDRARDNVYRGYYEWRYLGRSLMEDHNTHYTTKFMIGLCGIHPQIHEGIIVGLKYYPLCSSRLFSALIKSKLAKIADLINCSKHSWVLWAIRKIGIESVEDIKAIIGMCNGVLFHEALSHVCDELNLKQYNLHYIIAECNPTNAIQLHEALIQHDIPPTITDLGLSFSCRKYISTTWMYKWFLSSGVAKDADLLRLELYKSVTCYVFTVVNDIIRARILAEIKEITSSTEQQMVEFICRLLMYEELKAYMNYRNLSILQIDVSKIVKSSVTDPRVMSYLINISKNSVLAESFSDSE
jgi:hypothetical protein